MLVIQAGVVILYRFCYGGSKIEQLSQAVQVLAALASSSAGNREGWLFCRDFAVFDKSRVAAKFYTDDMSDKYQHIENDLPLNFKRSTLIQYNCPP